MVRLVELRLKPGKRAGPPLATPGAGPVVLVERPIPATSGWGFRGTYTTQGSPGIPLYLRQQGMVVFG